MAPNRPKEVLNRLAQLISHLLKNQHQSEMSSRSWANTIRHQRKKLQDLTKNSILYRVAENSLTKAYHQGVQKAVKETGLVSADFPKACPYSLRDLLDSDLMG